MQQDSHQKCAYLQQVSTFFQIEVGISTNFAELIVSNSDKTLNRYSPNSETNSESPTRGISFKYTEVMLP